MTAQGRLRLIWASGITFFLLGAIAVVTPLSVWEQVLGVEKADQLAVIGAGAALLALSCIVNGIATQLTWRS